MQIVIKHFKDDQTKIAAAGTEQQAAQPQPAAAKTETATAAEDQQNTAAVPGKQEE